MVVEKAVITMSAEWALVVVTVCGLVVTLSAFLAAGLVGFGKIRARFINVEEDVLKLIDIPKTLIAMDIRLKHLEDTVSQIDTTITKCEGCSGRQDVRIDELIVGQKDLRDRQIKVLENVATLTSQMKDTVDAMNRIHDTMMALASERIAGEKIEQSKRTRKRA